MTMMNAKEVIANLREKKKSLEDKLEAVTTWFGTNNTATRVSMETWRELREILGKG